MTARNFQTWGCNRNGNNYYNNNLHSQYNNYRNNQVDDNGYQHVRQKKTCEWITCGGIMRNGDWCSGWTWKSSMGPKDIICKKCDGI